MDNCNSIVAFEEDCFNEHEADDDDECYDQSEKFWQILAKLS